MTHALGDNPNNAGRSGRYARQIILPAVADAGQARLAAAHAAIVGCGAIGCAAADALARAGVGRLTIIDRDLVELSNLQRQGLFDEQDAAEGSPKSQAAARRLRAVNSDINIRPVIADLRAGNVENIITDAGVIVDATDNFEARYLLNDVAVRRGLVYVYGGVIGARGMQATFTPGGPCLRCVFDQPPQPGSQPTCETAGVLGPAAMMVGAMQAAGALRAIVSPDNSPAVLREFDAWGSIWREMHLARRSGCECCALRRFEFLDAPESDAVTLCGRDAVQVWPRTGATVDLPALAARLAGVSTVQCTDWMVRAHVEPGVEVTVFADGRAIVKGTREETRARALYAKWVGG